MFIIGFIFCLTLQKNITAQNLLQARDFKHRLSQCILLGSTIIATVEVVWMAFLKPKAIFFTICFLQSLFDNNTFSKYIDSIIILGRSVTTATTTGNVWNDSEF